MPSATPSDKHATAIDMRRCAPLPDHSPPASTGRSAQPSPALAGGSLRLADVAAEYADWLAAPPESLHDSPTAQALEVIVNLDTLADINLPRGFGRD